MKFESKLNTLIVYIFDKKYLNKDIDNITKNVFNILEKYYNYKINDSYEMKIYINKLYGIILEINIKENNFINIKVLKDVLFLYEIEDPLKYLDNEIYFYNNKYYINLKKENLNILENSNIIYGNDVYKIIGKGIKI